MKKFNNIKVEKYNEVNKMNYENRYNDNKMENKLNFINKALPRGYSYRRFDFIIDNIGNISVNTIKSLNNYLMKLYSECNTYYYNSDGFVDSLYDALIHVDLEKELAEIYGNELKIILNILFKFSEGEVNLTKDQFNSACSLILYLTKPNYLFKISEDWYTMSSKIYVLESVLDILNDLIKENNPKTYNNFFSTLISEIHGEYENQINEEYGFLEENNTEDDNTQQDNSLMDTFGGANDNINDNNKSKEVDEKSEGWGFDALDKFKSKNSEKQGSVSGITRTLKDDVTNKSKETTKKSGWGSFDFKEDKNNIEQTFTFEGEEVKEISKPEKRYNIDEELFGDSEVELDFTND